MLLRHWIPLAVFLVAPAWPCAAQDQPVNLRRDQRAEATSPVMTGLSPTPEMWFYEQERSRLEDPTQAVRRRAELRGQQRADRLAALKWYGIDNSRPTVSGTPWFGSYGPYWGSNTYDPMRWRQPTVPFVVVRPGGDRY